MERVPRRHALRPDLGVKVGAGEAQRAALGATAALDEVRGGHGAMDGVHLFADGSVLSGAGGGGGGVSRNAG